MKTKIFQSKLNAFKPFDIKKWTRISVRQTDINMKLFQECRVSRKDTDEVEVVLKEFGGKRFKVRISISTGCATLISPNLSWKANSHVFPILVAMKVAKMLVAKSSTTHLLLARRVDKIDASEK